MNSVLTIPMIRFYSSIFGDNDDSINSILSSAIEIPAQIPLHLSAVDAGRYARCILHADQQIS